MTDPAAIAAAPPPTGVQETMGSSRLGKDEFVKLLMAQLGNQDPTAPVDSHAFVAQLAQFASVELLQGVNSGLEALLMAEAAGNQTNALTLVGKEVAVVDDGITLPLEGGAPIQASLSGAADSVTVTILDADGKELRRISLGAQSAGRLETQWDGRDEDGERLAAGDYQVRITAADKSGESVDVVAVRRLRVAGVSFENGYPELIVGSERIKLADVFEVFEV